jgi:hypothetical protein
MELSVYIAPAWLLILSMIYAASSGRAGMRANSNKPPRRKQATKN